MQVLVRDNNVDQAMKVLKKKLQREGVLRELKRQRYYEKPSERKAREKSEAVRRGAQARAQARPARRPSPRTQAQRNDTTGRRRPLPGSKVGRRVVSGVSIAIRRSNPPIVSRRIVFVSIL